MGNINFKRTVKIPKELTDNLNEYKYNIIEEYDGFGIYEEITPSGYVRHQSYMITNNKFYILSESYMHNNLNDMKDLVDEYNENNSFIEKGLRRGYLNNSIVYILHNHGYTLGKI